MHIIAGAHDVFEIVGRVDAPPRRGDIGPAGVEEPGERTQGFPRNLGDLLISIAISARECRPRNFQAPGWASRAEGSETLEAARGTAGR